MHFRQLGLYFIIIGTLLLSSCTNPPSTTPTTAPTGSGAETPAATPTGHQADNPASRSSSVQQTNGKQSASDFADGSQSSETDPTVGATPINTMHLTANTKREFQNGPTPEEIKKMSEKAEKHRQAQKKHRPGQGRSFTPLFYEGAGTVPH